MSYKNKPIFNEKIERQAEMIIERIEQKFTQCQKIIFSVTDGNGNTHDIKLYLVGGEGPYGSSYDQYTFELRCKELGIEARYSLVTGGVQQEGWTVWEYPADLLQEALELILRHPLVVKSKLSDEDMHSMCEKINEATGNTFAANQIFINKITPDFISISMINKEYVPQVSQIFFYCCVSGNAPDWNVLGWDYYGWGEVIDNKYL